MCGIDLSNMKDIVCSIDLSNMKDIVCSIDLSNMKDIVCGTDLKTMYISDLTIVLKAVENVLVCVSVKSLFEMLMIFNALWNVYVITKR